ncbi:MAG: glutamine--fructose-6-phosphate transaminase (isomerizing) [Dehalococcoidia bacterium]|nr:glutamine--fructose-6-phosphate transaminase (isomerizing) [Dehalococcoidia bacterium]
MCGIMGYVGNKPATPILLDGLRRLEYRGYDSAGIAVIDRNGTLAVRKSVGKLRALEEQIQGEPPKGLMGVGHTRWATHGKPTTENAHPHTDCTGKVVVIHNGIIENYPALKQDLVARGHRFTSQTDTETLAHLLEEHLNEGDSLETGFRAALAHLRGASALIAMRRDEPDKVVAARLGNAGGIVVGYGKNEMFLASDLPALLPYTRQIAFLANREMAVVTAKGVAYYDLEGNPQHKLTQTIALDPAAATKGGYKHFMLKEIMEQPQAIANVMSGRVSFDPPGIHIDDLPFSDEAIRRFKRVVLVGMGSSFYAATLGRTYFEQLVQIPAEVENASEFRHREAWLNPETLMISVGQSGETVDTLGAMEEAQAKGVRQITICNVEGSQATRIADGTVYIRAGLEVGVASTKCMTNSVLALFLLAAHFGKVRGTVDADQMQTMVAELSHLPALLGGVLERDEEYHKLANHFHRFRDFLFLGRGPSYTVALEGALKLKEVSYIHAEAYPAGEMKHGPIALIDDNMPVVAIAPLDSTYEKMVSNVSEVKARDGIVLAVVSEGDPAIAELADFAIHVPRTHPLLTPLLLIAPLQLLAYHIAVRRGCDVDQPRNLAKTVTVE